MIENHISRLRSEVSNNYIDAHESIPTTIPELYETIDLVNKFKFDEIYSSNVELNPSKLTIPVELFGNKKNFKLLIDQVFTVFGGKEWFCSVSSGPTGNCQLATVQYTEAIFKYLGYKKERIEFLKKLFSCCRKKMYLFDILSHYEDALEELFPKDDIVVKSPYVSTSGSKMTLYIIKTKSLKN